ncbi:ABC transporter ATP-binding protein [Proteocatella sphenisci]|uniref:ABC transporter ATP-binding protein n=1 Tax=Proteocatella sphenisci TaxID=181070 RepID=UPI00048B0367|nr:ABC transporter ATP-binding protein [Proteocatella sphenisci]
MGIVKIDGLSVSFGKHEVLTDINIEIKKGEFVTILGPNGSGKTTLLKSISNMIETRKNTVWVDGQDVFLMKAKERARLMSVVPQNTDVVYEFTCQDVVMMGRYPHVSRFKGETEKDKDIVLKAMQTTNVEYLKDRFFTEISGGERQRVVLAQAIAQDPELILLDEPISNLDPQYQVEILDTVKKLSIEKGLTVIAILHDLNFASMYSDKVILMKEGKIFTSGMAQDVLTAENIKRVFDADVLVSKSPVINRPHIYSKSKGFFEKPKEKIHIVCGGGSGSDLIHELHHLGYRLSVCVLNKGDVDWQLAKDYGLDMVEESPFRPISEESYQKNLSNIKKADAVIICPVFFGYMNLENLEVLCENEVSDKDIYIIGDGDFKDRDFTDGRASEILCSLMGRKTCRKGFLDEDSRK